jgi:cobalt-zinc-cadmium efflux system outer membrane protein
MAKLWKMVVWMCFLQTLTAFAAESLIVEALSMEQVLRMAYIRNPQMMEARKAIDSAKGRRLQAEALPDPEIDFEIGSLKSEDQGGKKVRPGNLDSVIVSQPLDPIGTRFLKGSMAADDVRIAQGELDIRWAEIRKRVIALYANILAAEKAVEVARDNFNTTKQFFARVETRFQAGNALRSDVLRAKIEVSRAENDFLINEKDLKIFKSQLNLAIGRTAEEPLALTDALGYEPLHYEYEKIKQTAAAQRVDIKNETRRLSSTRKGFWSAVLKTIFPKMTLGYERATQDYSNDSSLLLGASYPLWGFNFGEVKAAKAEQEQQEIRLEALKNQVGLEAYQALIEAELADKQVALQQNALDEANELLRQITIKYEEGDLPFLNYLENLRTIKETRLAYFNALKSYKEKVAELESAIQQTPVPSGVG